MRPKFFPLFATVRTTLWATRTLSSLGYAATDQTWLDTNADNTWNGPNWSGAPWANGNNAIFGGTGETVALTAPVTVGNITFNSAGYTISGSTLTLGASTIDTVANSATISSVLAGTGKLTKVGNGSLVLTGANTYTG